MRRTGLLVACAGLGLLLAPSAGAQTVITNMQSASVQLYANKIHTYYYKIWVPSGCGELRITAEYLPSWPSFDIYAGPSLSSLVYKHLSAGQSKRVVIGYPQPGWWYIRINCKSLVTTKCTLRAAFNAAVFSEVKLGSERKVIWLSALPGITRIENNKETWVVPHGKAFPGETMGGADVSVKNAQGLSRMRAPGALQVLTADWMECSFGQIWDLSNTRWVPTVGETFVNMLKPIIGTKNLSLLGHSWGTYVSYEMSKQLWSKLKKKVDVMYMIDPAQMGWNYNYNDVDFRKYSNKSMAFLTSSLEGNAELAKRASHSFVVGKGWKTFGVDYAGHGDFKDITMPWILDRLAYANSPKQGSKVLSPFMNYSLPWASGRFDKQGWSGWQSALLGYDYEGVLIVTSDRTRPVSLKYQAAVQKKWWFFGWHYYYEYQDRHITDF